MKEIHVLAFVQTERKNGTTTFKRRENKVAFTDVIQALQAAEDQCFAMFEMYRNLGYGVTYQEERMTSFHYFGDDGLVGSWNFYVDSMTLID